MRRVMRIAVATLAFAVAVSACLMVYANVRIETAEILTADELASGRFISVEGRRWHVVTAGNLSGRAADKPPVLLIHGFGVPAHMLFLPLSHRLERHRLLIIPDLLGYGFSDRSPQPGSHYTLTGYAASLAVILDELGVDKVDVVGHSYGGLVAARFALDYPTRVRRVVFMAAPVYAKPNAGDALVRLPLGIGRGLTWHLFGAGPLSFLMKYCKAQRAPDCVNSFYIKNTTDTLRAMMDTNRSTPNLAALPGDLDRFTAPSMVMWGADDPFFAVAFGQRLAVQVKGKLEVVDGARHLPFLQKPDEVEQRLLKFLEAD
jgi:abhydrolase domain-containing protein 6